MIRSFKSRSLKLLWEKNDPSKLDARLTDRILRRLDTLNQAISPEEMNKPGFNFHRLRGNRAGTCTVHVNGPWYITFEWDGTDAIDVDLEDYH